MPRPVARRRGREDAPDAEQYTSRRGRSTEDDGDGDDDRRPRRGRERGELPSRGRRAASKPDIPTIKELEKFTDDELVDFAKAYDIPTEDADGDLDGETLFNDIADKIEAGDLEQAPEDEPPARSRRGRGSDDEEDKPRGRGRSREAEDEEPSRGRRGRSDEPEDEPPARGRGRGRSRDDEDEAPRGRGRGRGRDDEDDKPRRTARSGFEGFKKTRAETSSFADDFKLTDEEVLVKFLDDEPFATYAEHGLFQELKQGQRVWTCLAPEEECAICNTGHEARAVALWNIVVMPEEGAPKIKVLKAGPKLEGIIEKKAALKTGPMSKEYYSLSQTEGKNNGPVEYAVEVIRERDLKEEWKEEPFTNKELDAFDEKKYDVSFVKYPSISDVKEIARKLRNSDD